MANLPGIEVGAEGTTNVSILWRTRRIFESRIDVVLEIGDNAEEYTDDTDKGGRMMILKRKRRIRIMGKKRRMMILGRKRRMMILGRKRRMMILGRKSRMMILGRKRRM